MHYSKGKCLLLVCLIIYERYYLVLAEYTKRVNDLSTKSLNNWMRDNKREERYMKVFDKIIVSIKAQEKIDKIIKKHDSMDFVPLLEHSFRLVPIGTVVADMGYDSEQNHVAAQNMRIANTIIRPKYENLQVHKTREFHRKMMKRHFDWDEYN